MLNPFLIHFFKLDKIFIADKYFLRSRTGMNTILPQKVKAVFKDISPIYVLWQKRGTLKFEKYKLLTIKSAQFRFEWYVGRLLLSYFLCSLIMPVWEKLNTRSSKMDFIISQTLSTSFTSIFLLASISVSLPVKVTESIFTDSLVIPFTKTLPGIL